MPCAGVLSSYLQDSASAVGLASTVSQLSLPQHARNSPFIVMVYARPDASDFDDWETTYKNAGWGSRDLIPLLKRVSLGIIIERTMAETIARARHIR